MGQGDGIYLDAGEDVMIDGGSSSTKKIGEYTIEPFLKSKKTGDIEKAFISHADGDHVSGMLYLAETGEIRIRELYLPWCAEDDENYDEIRGIAEHVNYLRAGDTVQLKRGIITCLYPGDETASDDMNDQSLVLLYEEENFSALFMGDASIEAEQKLKHLKPVTVLKVGHHGSKTSTGEELLEQTKPKLAVLSYGEGNRYGHPSPETVELLEANGIKILRTAERGAITVLYDRKDCKMYYKMYIN